MIIVPAIDLFDGKVIRVKQGDLGRAQIYSDDPLRTAIEFVSSGAKMIHVVDLNAAVKSDTVTNKRWISSLLAGLGSSAGLEIAGGIRSTESATSFVDQGAARVVVGSIAYSDLKIAVDILKTLGENRVVLALDYDDHGNVKTSGWTRSEGESALKALTRFYSLGFMNFLMTSIDRDGMMSGPDLENLSKFKKAVGGRGKIIASGGISTQGDISRLDELEMDEAIIGKGFYEKTMPMSIFKRVIA